MPYLRYIAFSHSDSITTRDNNKMVRLIQSPAYQQLWGDRFRMVKTGERRIENDQTGYKVATSVGGVSTGERGDRVILDDPHNVIKAESDLEREKTVRFVRESMSNRLNDEQSAIVIIMQRLHEGDVSGDILAREADYCHLMIPMYFDPLRYPASADVWEGLSDWGIPLARSPERLPAGAPRRRMIRRRWRRGCPRRQRPHAGQRRRWPARPPRQRSDAPTSGPVRVDSTSGVLRSDGECSTRSGKIMGRSSPAMTRQRRCCPRALGWDEIGLCDAGDGCSACGS
jgi:hypothetical protein